MQTVKMLISYDGSQYSGWQRQRSAPSVQGEIEGALSNLFAREILISGASRTDAGVSAEGQVAVVEIDDFFPVDNLASALNTRLPNAIFIRSCKRVKSDFSPRYDVIKKTYVYRINNGEYNPLLRNSHAHVSYAVDLERINEFLRMIQGEHNFKGYCSSSAQVKTFDRIIYEAKLTKRGNILTFTFTGNGFLQHMIRILVGTAIDIGRGKLSIEQARRALVEGNRALAGKTMPPEGLVLKKIIFRR